MIESSILHSPFCILNCPVEEAAMPDRNLPDLSMFLSDYLNDAKEGFQAANKALLALENDPSQKDRLNEIFRAVHTLKSSSAMLDCRFFGTICSMRSPALVAAELHRIHPILR